MTEAREFAYRASTELEAAVRAAWRDVEEWRRTVLAPWQETTPVRALPVADPFGTVLDCRYVGFEDAEPNLPPPDGLSRNRKRRELIPVSGAKGDRWREALELLGTRPKISNAFALHGVELGVLDVDHGMIRRPMLAINDEPGLWLKYSVLPPRPAQALEAIPLSEWYEVCAAHKRVEEAARVAG